MANRSQPNSDKYQWYKSRRLLNKAQMVMVYSLLTAGALFMLFPLVWMVSASLKPEWQVFTQPIIWIPQKWHQQEAGDTGRMFNLWLAKQNGATVRVVKIATTNYNTVVDVDNISHLYSLAADEVSEPTPSEVDGVRLNVRTARIAGEQREVVTLARDGDNLIVVEMDELGDCGFVSKPDLRKAARLGVAIDGIGLEASQVNIDGIERLVVPVGGEVPYSTVVSAETLSKGELVLARRLRSLGVKPVGDYDMKLFELVEDNQKLEVISLADETCSSIVDYSAIQQAFTVRPDELTGEPEMRPVGQVELEVQQLAANGQDVVILLRGTDNVLVIDPNYMGDARTACTDVLFEPRLEIMFDGGELLIMDSFGEQGRSTRAVAILGERQLMATILPVEALVGAFDVPDASLRRATRPKLNIDNYRKALSLKLGKASFLTFFRNSTILVVLNIIGQTLSCTIVAYGFARLRAPGKNVLFIILLATMMLPFPVTMVPLYEIFVRAGELTRDMGVLNIGQDTFWPLFVRAFFGNAFFIFLMRQFFMSIPVELEEAARIDGANRLQVLVYVLLPLIKPALTTVVVFTFMWIWNDFMEPLIFLDSARNYTVTLGLNFFKGQYSADYHLLMAASVVALLPMVIVFFFAQRFFIEGITLTGLKG